MRLVMMQGGRIRSWIAQRSRNRRLVVVGGWKRAPKLKLTRRGWSSEWNTRQGMGLVFGDC